VLQSLAVLKRVDRLVMIELIPPFLFATFAFLVLIIGAALLKPLLDFVIKYGVRADLFFELLLLSLPQWVVYTFPMAMLSGTLLAVGRLSGDSEVTALRAAGVSLYRITSPILFFALLLSLITFVINEQIAPYTNYRFDAIKQHIIQDKTGQIAQSKVSIEFYRQGYLSYLLLADKLEDQNLTDLNLLSFDPSTHEYTWHLQAQNARWSGNEWSFYRGVVHSFLEEGVVTTKFDEWEVPDFNLSPADIALKSKNPNELSVFDLRKIIGLQKQSGLDASVIRRFQVEYYFKFSIPFSPLFFVLIGVPLAIMPLRSSTSMGMGMSLLIVLFYFLLYTLSMQMGRGGIIAPPVAAWIPNGAVFLAGLALMRARNR
jgi:lipopolysaccharide export system permease protein